MTQITLERHPLSACFGDMNDDEFQKFKDDIDVHGQYEPVLIFEGMVLDGWHRYKAVTQLGMPVQKFAFTGTFEDAQERVVSSNDKRKHRTVSQRAQALVAVFECKPVGRPAANSAPGAELKKPTAKSAKEIATAHGIGTRSVERARVIQAAGLAPMVLEGVLSGKDAEAIATGAIDKMQPAKIARGTSEKPAPEASNDDGPSTEELAANAAAEQADREAMEKLLDADDKLASAWAEIKRLNSELAQMRIARDGYMNKANEAIALVKKRDRQIDAMQRDRRAAA